MWLRLDRIRKPLEALYQGPFEVIKRNADTFTIKVKGEEEVVSIQRIKPAVLPAVESKEKEEAKKTEESSPEPRQKRKVKHNHDVQYFYY